MNIINFLLTEAADLTDGEKILKAFEKGMIPGVKKKVFFKETPGTLKYTEKSFIKVLKHLVEEVTAANFGNNYNAAMFLILKKAGNYSTLFHLLGRSDFHDWLDSVKAYFNNRNKQEAKNEEGYRKRFEAFVTSPYHYDNDKRFEQWVNEKFAQKATIKDESKEIQTVYPKDAEGWEVLIPKTFAAAKKLACMRNRKASWCTSATVNMFKEYTKKDNPLYIIRNEKKNIMFQMDWGTKGMWSGANFKNERDMPVKVQDFIKHNPPDALTKKLKNKKGKTLFDFLEEASPKDKSERKGKWEEKFSKGKEFIDLIRQALSFLKVPSQNISKSVINFIETKTIEDAISGRDPRNYYAGIVQFSNFSVLKNDDEDHFYVVVQGNPRSRTRGIMSNPIVKFDNGKPDIGSIPKKTADMISGSEKVKGETTLKPILTDKNVNLYKLNSPEDIKQFVRETQEKAAIYKVGGAFGDDAKDLYLIKFGITKILFKKGNESTVLKITSDNIAQSQLYKQASLLKKSIPIFKKVIELAGNPFKKLVEEPFFHGNDYSGNSVYYENELNKNSKGEMRKKIQELISMGYKIFKRKDKPLPSIDKLIENGFQASSFTKTEMKGNKFVRTQKKFISLYHYNPPKKIQQKLTKAKQIKELASEL